MVKEDETKKEKLNRLIIIGNGFDLSLGLKTGYKDFLYDYLKGILKTINDSNQDGWKIHKFKEHVQYENELLEFMIPISNINQLLNFEFKRRKNYEELTEYLFEDDCLIYKFQLLQKFHNNSVNKRWTDIEILYYDSLVKILDEEILGKKILNMRKELEDVESNEIARLIYEFNKQFSILRNELITYLKTIKLPWEEGVKIKLLKRECMSYTSTFFDTLMESKKDQEEINDITIVNFNYTESLKSLLSICSKKEVKEVIHIHGEIEDKESVIFGFGDELDKNYQSIESERSQELFKYIKSPHYFQSMNYKKLNSFINNNRYEVYILGHSCGISDRTLLNEIFENNRCESIRIFYHEKQDGTNNKLETSIEIMKHFKDKIKMREKIKPFTEEDKMRQIKKNEN